MASGAASSGPAGSQTAAGTAVAVRAPLADSAAQPRAVPTTQTPAVARFADTGSAAFAAAALTDGVGAVSSETATATAAAAQGAAAATEAPPPPSPTTAIPAQAVQAQLVSTQAMQAPPSQPAPSVAAPTTTPLMAAARQSTSDGAEAPAVQTAAAAQLDQPQLVASAAPPTTPPPASPAPTSAALTGAQTPAALSPAAQAMPVLTALASAGASQSITLKLDPGELGRLDIRIDRSADGPVAVRLTAEKPQTLALLTRDQAALERTLDQAGVPAQGRTISYHAAGPDGLATDGLRAAQPTSHAAAPPALGLAQTPTGAAAGEAFRHAASSDPGMASTGGGQAGNAGSSEGQRQRGGTRSGPSQSPDDAAPAAAPWRVRPATAGIDITA